MPTWEGEGGGVWEAEETTPGFRGLPLPGVNCPPTLPGSSTLMGFQPGLTVWEPRISDRKRTKRWIRFIHGFAGSTYVCSACFYAVLFSFFFAQDMQYSFQRYVK